MRFLHKGETHEIPERSEARKKYEEGRDEIYAKAALRNEERALAEEHRLEAERRNQVRRESIRIAQTAGPLTTEQLLADAERIRAFLEGEAKP
jgi:hypothetical protein